MKQRFQSTLLAVGMSLAAIISFDQEMDEPNRIMFTNVNVFDGVSESLAMGTDVLVEDDLIAAVGSSISVPEGAQIIDGGGRTLMPGLIDAHVHLNLQMLENPLAIDGVNNLTWEEVGAMAYESAQEYL